MPERPEESVSDGAENKGGVTAAREVKPRKPSQDGKSSVLFLINNREEDSSHDGWGDTTTSDSGLLYRQPIGRENPAFVFLRAATALRRVCIQHMNAALDSFGGRSQKKVMR